MHKVFVTDGGQRKTLSVVRSLGKKGISVTVGDETVISLSRFSKYCHKFILYPSPKRHPERFYQFLLEHIKRNKYDVLMPVDNETILIAARYREEISKYTLLPVADPSTIMKAWNKAQTIKLAKECGIPCPQTLFIEKLEELQTLKNKLKYPIVIKPQESYGSRGMVIVNSPKKLLSSYQKVHAYYPFPLVQELIPQKGEKYQVSALFDQNREPKAVFVQRILRQYPVNQGSDTLSESVYSPEIQKLGIKLLRYLNWYGVAGVEFIVDPRDRIPKLMEINPRFWASLQLAIFSGVDFPHLLYQMVVNGRIEKIDEYKVGMRYRWLLLGDILSFLFDTNRFKRKPSFFDFSYTNSTTYAILSKEDTGPAFGFILTLLKNSLNIKMWRLLINRKGK